MKKTLFGIMLFAVLALCLPLTAYDVKNPALHPVTFQKTPQHADIPLIKNGKLNFVIVAPLKNESRTRRTNRTPKSIEAAVETLKEAFEKCTGITPAVIDAENPEKWKKHPYRIIVGDCAEARRLGFDPKKLPTQGFEIRTFANGILIAGVDTSLIKGYNKKKLDRKGTSEGTKFAAYDFTERFLGVRYYFPGQYGSIWPEIKELTIKPVSYRDWPRILTRNGIFYLGNSISSPASRKFWSQYMGPLTKKDVKFYEYFRMGCGACRPSGHCPSPTKFAKSHPDKLKKIFYTSPAGSFWYNSKGMTGNIFDVVNLENFAEIMIDSLKRFYESDGKIDEGNFYDLGCSSEYIAVGQCDTLLPDGDLVNDPTVKKLGLMKPEDIARNAGQCNVYARFYQYMAKRIKEEFPGKKLFFSSYYRTTYPGNDPRWILPDNVSMALTTGQLQTKFGNPKVNAMYLKLAQDWQKSTVSKEPIFKFGLYNYDSHSDVFLRAISGENTGKIIKMMMPYTGNLYYNMDHNSNAPGIIWFTYPSVFATYHLQWNPDWDYKAAIDEHWELMYGKKAAPHLRAFHQLLRDCWQKYYVPSDDKFTSYPTPELEKMERYLAAAAKAIKPGTPEAQRFKLFSACWPKTIESMKAVNSYVRPVYEIHHLLPDEKVSLDTAKPEAFWKKLPLIALGNRSNLSETRKDSAKMRLAWDKKGIYGYFERDHAPLATKKKDVWGNCSYELFISPGIGRETNHQFVFDAMRQTYFGMQRFLPVPQPRNDNWHVPGFKFVTEHGKDYWRAKVFIPFALFERTPKPYENWIANFVANDRARKFSVGSSLTRRANQNLAMYAFIKFNGIGD